tara:strand:+ start:2887 stop:3981 length:1095 start_codon:yes stop_codon:yes gene_type:complete
MTNLTGINARKHSIEIRIEHQNHRYIKSIKLEPTKANLNFAAAQRILWREELAKGSLPSAFEKPSVYFQHSLDTWMEIVENEYTSRGTKSMYRTYHKELSESFGKLALDKITIGIVKDWCRAQTCGSKTISNKLSFMRKALGEAFDAELISTNILKNWSFVKVGKVNKADDIIPLSMDEERLILAAFDQEQCRNVYQFQLWTGLRPSETVALTWSDVDFNSGIINVQRAKTAYDIIAGNTKTEGSRRNIKMTSKAREALLNQRKFTKLHGHEVFHDPDTNTAWESSTPLRLVWRTALKRAGVKYRKPYITRHSYASRMLISGETPLYVQSQLGHETLEMLIKHYAKWIPSQDLNSGNKLEEMFA